MKKKILFVNESSSVASGFGTYGNELISRLYEAGFDIAEFAIGATVEGLRATPRPWPRYANAVRADDGRYKEYNSKPSNKKGEWRFERVLLDYRPSTIIDIRDPWDLMFEGTSPLRRFYHWIISPTVDSAPQKEEWLDIFGGADSVFTYTDWGGKVLTKQNPKINFIDALWPGVDLEIFKPLEDIKKHRRKLGFNEDAIIIGMVARNQVRKLFPDLFKAFRMFLDQHPELSEKVYLYCHTSYPDVGWDIPYWMNYYHIGHKVLFSYLCEATGQPFVSKFQGPRTYSPFSNAATGIMPNTNLGFTREHLAQVYQLFDYYIQYAVAEGLGFPMLEAAACGVPVAATNYSAMEDVVEKTGGFPIKIGRTFHDFGTQSVRALPDLDHTVELFTKFATMQDFQKKEYSIKARKAAEKYFDWNKTAKKLGNYIESLDISGVSSWDSPPKLVDIPQFTKGMSNRDFIRWIYDAVIDEPHRTNSTESLSILRDLNYGYVQEGLKMKPFTQEMVYKMFVALAENKNICEQNRCGMLKPPMTDYIEYARNKT